MNLDPKVQKIITVAVVGVWAVAQLAAFFKTDIEVPPALNAAAMAIIGTAYAVGKKTQPGKDEPPKGGESE